MRVYLGFPVGLERVLEVLNIALELRVFKTVVINLEISHGLSVFMSETTIELEFELS